MSDERDLIERTIRRWEPPGPAMERLLRRRDRKRRNQRIGAAAVALVIALLVVGTLGSLERSLGPRPADAPITPENVSDLHLAWSATVEGRPVGLAATDEAIYLATTGGRPLERYPVTCGEAARTCEPEWFGQPSNARAAGVAIADGRIYLTSDRLYTFDDPCDAGAGGCPPNAAGVVEGSPREPVAAGDRVLLATGDNRLYAFSGANCDAGGTCTPEWVSRRTTTQFVHPVVVGDTVIVTDEVGGAYEAFPLRCATDGSVCEPSATWSLPQGWGRYSPPAVAGNTMYTSVWTNTHEGIDAALFALPISCLTGEGCPVLWKAPVDPTSSVGAGTPVVAGDRVIVAMTEGTVVQAFPLTCDAARCGPLWTGEVNALLGNSLTPVVLNGLVFAPGEGGGASAFAVDCATDGGTCTPLWTDTGEGAPTLTNAGAVAVAGDHIVLAGGESGSGRLEVFALGPAPSAASTSTGPEPAVGLYLIVAGLVLVTAVALIARRRRSGL